MNERRRALVIASAAAAAFGSRVGHASTDPPPETRRIRISKIPSACAAPIYVAETLLRQEGFEQVEYLPPMGLGGGIPEAHRMGAGDVDMGMNFAAPIVMGIDQGAAVSVLAGVHAGCYEVFANKTVANVADLKGKTVAVLGRHSAQHTFLASIATSVGVDPNRDIRWVHHLPSEGKRLLADGSIDAYLGFPPDPQELRARKVGRSLLNSAIDRPWSQYFCCLIVANREWVARHPNAARRAVRAILKASELCAADTELAARSYLAHGFQFDPVYLRQGLRELPFGKWREYNPEETMRFYSLRLREAEMVKNAPQKIIASGSDWRILNRLRKELKT